MVRNGKLPHSLRKLALIILVSTTSLLSIHLSNKKIGKSSAMQICPVPIKPDLHDCKFNNRSWRDLEDLWGHVPGFTATPAGDPLRVKCRQGVIYWVLRKLYEEEHLLPILRAGSLLEVYRKKPVGDSDVDVSLLVPKGLSKACVHEAVKRVVSKLSDMLDKFGRSSNHVKKVEDGEKYFAARYVTSSWWYWIYYDNYEPAYIQLRTFNSWADTGWQNFDIEILPQDLVEDLAFDARMRSDKRGISTIALFNHSMLCRCTVNFGQADGLDYPVCSFLTGDYSQVCHDEPVVVDYLEKAYGKKFMVPRKDLERLGQVDDEDGFDQSFDNRRAFFRSPLGNVIYYLFSHGKTR